MNISHLSLSEDRWEASWNFLFFTQYLVWLKVKDGNVKGLKCKYAFHLPAGSQAHQESRRMSSRITASVTQRPSSTVPVPWVTRPPWSESHCNEVIRVKIILLQLWVRRETKEITRQKVKCSSVYWMRAMVLEKVQREYRWENWIGVGEIEYKLYHSTW